MRVDPNVTDCRSVVYATWPDTADLELYKISLTGTCRIEGGSAALSEGTLGPPATGSGHRDVVLAAGRHHSAILVLYSCAVLLPQERLRLAEVLLQECQAEGHSQCLMSNCPAKPASA